MKVRIALALVAIGIAGYAGWTVLRWRNLGLINDYTAMEFEEPWLGTNDATWQFLLAAALTLAVAHRHRIKSWFRWLKNKIG